MNSKAHLPKLLVFAGLAFTGLVLICVFINGDIIRILSAKPDLKDGGFLSGEPCGPPCFLGITPNVTTEEQAVQILKAKGLYRNCHIFNNEDESGLRGAACADVEIAYYRSSDLVGSISFSPSQPITVEMVIAKYGNPDAVSVSTIWFNWEKQPTTSMGLIYDRIHAVVGLGEQESSTFYLTPTTRISAVGYSDQTFPSVREYEAIAKYRSSWQGYGWYQEPQIPGE